MPGESRFLKLIPEKIVIRPDTSNEKADLHELKKQVLQLKKEAAKEVVHTEIVKEEKTEVKRVRHPKYGEGIITLEDEMVVEVEFEGYGKKRIYESIFRIRISLIRQRGTKKDIAIAISFFIFCVSYAFVLCA